MRKLGIERERQSLRRVLGLAWLVFYGVGVTVGAGIFALIAQIVGLAGDHAPLAFLIAGLVAGITGVSYALLAGTFPRAAGEAIFVEEGLGSRAGRVIGFAVLFVAVTSSATIGLAFARYLASMTGIPDYLDFLAVLVGLAAIAVVGVRESVALAAVVTVLEVGTLLLVVVVAAPSVVATPDWPLALSPPGSTEEWKGVMTGAFVAFFAFIGFEDIVNMAEETRDAEQTVPRAVVLTLVISVAIYAAVGLVAAAYPDRAGLAASEAPLADIYAVSTGLSGLPIAVMATLAMVNGILVQIVMASRLIYGMARDGMLPSALATVHPERRTPVVPIVIFTACAALFGLVVPFLQLAELTSLVVLLIFTVVNVSLFCIGIRSGAPARLRRWRFWGLAGAAASLALIAAEVVA
jgi:APA family basic amino acid/polyamine antiporter